MGIALHLLGDARWRDSAVVGERPQALLAALAAARGRAVSDSELIAQVWGDDPPASAQKSLQVLVSRTRSACGADVITRDAAGYALGAGPGEVDAWKLAELVGDGQAALEGAPPLAAKLAREALALAAGLAAPAPDDTGPLAELRRDAAADAGAARLVLARADSRMGSHGDALAPLETAWAGRPGDESLLADLLHSEAAVRGPAAALDRYEDYRRGLRDRLGAEPGEALRRVHRDLLALDRPVRRGLRYDATALLGRDEDLSALHGLLASHRVVSVVGPGGLGKTRLAQAIARDELMPAVHVVELAGVAAPDDVVGEVGSVLGVRDSLPGSRIRTAEQRADVRARIAARLAAAPGLLVLDNCEHLLDAVASLVAFLVSVTSDLRVLTTSRAALGIAAEHVYLLAELQPADAAELFRDRATAARPTVRLPEQAVASVVSRLDGLPLAIELAAVQVRAMSVEEIDRRLADRFALLRGGDRSAPDRHQTLLAVIDWSWHLLDDRERRALGWLALFNDGFTLEAAEQVLGPDAITATRGLVAQSLLSVRESPAGVRYRMLETVREFGRIQLAQAGEEGEARAAVRRWAVSYARAHADALNSREQFAAIDAVSAEEVNLADELRLATAEGDAATVAQLLTALGMFWTIRGEHARMLAIADAITGVLAGWQPPAGLEGVAGAAIAILLTNTMIAGGGRIGQLREQLRKLAGRAVTFPVFRLVASMVALDPADADASRARLAELSADPDHDVAVAASQWLAGMRENDGDLAGAIKAAQRALAIVNDDDGPWSRALSNDMLARLLMHVGDADAAVGHARAALPVLQRLGATDDEVQNRALLVNAAIAGGDLAGAQAGLEQIEEITRAGTVFGGMSHAQTGRAELLLARGEHARGLALYRECAAQLQEFEMPGVPRSGLEPWTLYGAAVALTAHAHYAGPAEEADGRKLFEDCRRYALAVLGGQSWTPEGAPGAPFIELDLPVAGMLLFALGAWSLLHAAAPPGEDLHLLALAERFAYNRSVPSMAWERIVPAAEQAAPGLLEEYRARYAGDRPASLLARAREVVARLPERQRPPP